MANDEFKNALIELTDLAGAIKKKAKEISDLRKLEKKAKAKVGELMKQKKASIVELDEWVITIKKTKSPATLNKDFVTTSSDAFFKENNFEQKQGSDFTAFLWDQRDKKAKKNEKVDIKPVKKSKKRPAGKIISVPELKKPKAIVAIDKGENIDLTLAA